MTRDTLSLLSPNHTKHILSHTKSHLAQITAMMYDFEFERLKSEIGRRKARVVGIQLPAGLRHHASEIARRISEECGVEVIISGNSCYGACDIDEKVASIVDILFHFGHSAVPTNLNVVFVELRCNIDVRPAVENALKCLEGDKICVTTTVQHVHKLNDVVEVLRLKGKHAIIGEVGGGRVHERNGSVRHGAFDNNECVVQEVRGMRGMQGLQGVQGMRGVRARYDGQVLGCDLRAAMVDCDEILFVGSGDFHPTAIAMTTGKRVVAADPFTRCVSVFTPEPLINRRLLRVEKAMSASSFGIIVGTKTGQFHLQTALSLREKAEKRGIRTIIIAMDEIREDLLCEFDVDAFVITACPRLVDSLSLEKAVISPLEFEVVLGERTLNQLLPASK